MAGNPKLTVLFEKLRGKSFELDKDVMSIGRRDGMDICIKDGSLSGHHADLIRKDHDGKVVYTIRDNDSTNGTRVNNIPVTEQELKNSDIILLGAVEVLYDNHDEDATSIGSTTVTIDISQLDSNMSTVPKLNNLDPFANQSENKSNIGKKIALAGIGLLILLVIALIIWVVVAVLN